MPEKKWRVKHLPQWYTAYATEYFWWAKTAYGVVIRNSQSSEHNPNLVGMIEVQENGVRSHGPMLQKKQPEVF